MKVLVAPDSFKGTYSAAQVARAIATGITESGGEALQLPVADGGEGTYDALCSVLETSEIVLRVPNAWGEMITATMGLSDDGTAVIEVSQASGLTPGRINPRDALTATTYGTGVLITAAIERGARHVLVAAGGSATTDGGLGAVQAINDANGLQGARITVLADVKTPFEHASRVFAPQKGADAATVMLLEERLNQLSRRYSRNPFGVPRTGAAGGLAGGLWAQFGAELVSGAEAVLDVSRFDTHLHSAVAVVVGEGRLDGQTRDGKIISVILDRVERSGRAVPVIAVVGSLGEDLASYAKNFAKVIIATDTVAMHEAGRSITALLQS